MKYLVLLALLPFAAFATDPKPPPKPPQHPPVSVNANAAAAAKADAAATAAAVANTGPVSQALMVEDNSVALGQGSIYIPDCGAGANAGGGSRGATGFLGIAYIPAWCQDFMYAKWLWSIGDYDAACAVMTKSKVGKRAVKKGIVPACAAPPPPQAASASVEVPPVVVNVNQNESCGEKVDRMFVRCVRK